MEGISHEAASLAGHLGLGRLVYVYDDNHITIDGPTELAYSDNVAERFDAYGWHTDDIGEVANDTDALEAALRRAMAVEDKPSMILLRSHIGWPSPHKTDTADAHGSPAGRGRDPRDQGPPRPPPRPAVLGPRRGARVLPAQHRAGAGRAPRVAGPLRRLGRRQGRMGGVPAGSGPGGLGRASSRCSRPGRASPPGWPSTSASTPLPTPIPGLVAGLGRSHREHRGEARRRREPVRRSSRRRPDPLRDPRARHGARP